MGCWGGNRNPRLASSAAMLVYWSSRSGNTRRFVEKLGLPFKDLGASCDAPYLLVFPTYADGNGDGAVPKPVIRFLNVNRHLMLGVIGGGNRNFGASFCLGARVVSVKCSVPLLHRFELAGTDADVDAVREAYGKLFSS